MDISELKRAATVAYLYLQAGHVCLFVFGVVID